MGEVCKAWDEGLQRHVALKLLRWDDPDLVQRLLREARAQARLDHPNICRVYQVGEHAGRPTIAMQFIDGESLSEAAEEMTLEAKVSVVRDVADALHHAHAAGIVHRDLKPGNIMVERREEGTWHPWVVDFGIAHEVEAPGLTREGQAMGTPSYMAPEQVTGEPGSIDRRTDVYALGAVLYELLTGGPPFDADTDMATMISVLEKEPRPPRAVVPSVPRDLETIALRCLEKEPHRRYQSAAEVVADLDRWRSGEPIAARRTSWAGRVVVRARRHPLQAALVGAVIAAMLITIGTWVHGRQVAQRTARVAQQFGRDVERIDARMRLAHLVPPHDIRSDRETVRRMVASLEDELASVGAPARAAGHSAVGRAYRVLGELESAREHLEHAAELGETSSAQAHARGLTLAGLYREALQAAAGLRDPELRVRKIEAARRELAEPARAALGRVDVSNSGESYYARGLIALFEERFDDAVQHARSAVAADPWLYEAVRLEGDVALAREYSAFESGEHEEARQYLQQAGEVYRRAIAIGRSDPELYEIECERTQRLIDLEIATGGDLAAAMETAEASCTEALQIDPASGSLHSQLSVIYARHGQELWWNRGEDPSADLERAATHGQRAVELAPDDPRSHVALGLALYNRSQWLIHRGEDATDLIGDAARSFESGVELDASLVEGHVYLGRCHLQLGRQLMASGGDPREQFALAIDAVNTGLAIDPDLVGSLNLLGGLHMTQADWETRHGIDSRPTLDAALDAFSRASEINPSSPRILNNIGLTAWILGDLERMLGEDPRPSFERAADSLETALDVREDLVSARINLSGVHYTRAKYALRSGEDPRPYLERSYAELARIREVYPNDFYVDWADCLILEARLLLRRARPPVKKLDRAADELRAGLEHYPERAGLHRALAQVSLLRGTWAGEQGEPVRQHVLAGHRHVDEALRLDPSLAVAYVVQGRLHLLAAESFPTGERRRTSAAAAVESFRQALEHNPLLEREVSEELREAERVSEPRSVPG
jgi:serine/threonine-protein kinase